MFSVLINAYACGPEMGSEPGMAWNWIKNLANHCKVFVITEGEWKDEIDTALRELPQRRNIIFFYNPVSEKVRKMCWNQGDWRFYYYYKRWQKKTFKIAQAILIEYKIDIIHQLNMIGYREPGYLWKINSLPTVWGPVGGFTTIPFAFLTEFSLKNKIGWLIKNIFNNLQSHYSIRLNMAINNFSVIIGATPVDERRLALLSSNKKKVLFIPETGSEKISFDNSKKDFQKLKIAWIGKFDERKALPLALRSLSGIKNLKKIEFHILGSGDNMETYKQLAFRLKISDICYWHGQVKKKQVHEYLKETNLLFFSSLQDATSSVVLEALSLGVPVLCHDANGYGAIVNEKCGFKIPFKTSKISTQFFHKIISELAEDPEKLKVLSAGALAQSIKHSWEEHSKQMMQIYSNLINKEM